MINNSTDAGQSDVPLLIRPCSVKLFHTQSFWQWNLIKNLLFSLELIEFCSDVTLLSALIDLFAFTFLAWLNKAAVSVCCSFFFLHVKYLGTSMPYCVALFVNLVAFRSHVRYGSSVFDSLPLMSLEVNYLLFFLRCDVIWPCKVKITPNL